MSEKDSTTEKKLDLLAETIIADLQSGAIDAKEFLKFLKGDLFSRIKKAMDKMPKEKKEKTMTILGLKFTYDGEITNEKIKTFGHQITAVAEGLGNGLVSGFKNAWKQAMANKNSVTHKETEEV